MKLVTKIFGIPVATTDIDGKAQVDIPQFTVLHFSGIRTKTKVKGPFGVTLAKSKGWLVTPFDVTSGPIQGDAAINGMSASAPAAQWKGTERETEPAGKPK